MSKDRGSDRLIGEGLTYRNGEVVRLMRQHDVEDYVILLGTRSDIPDIMNAIDIHVLSSVSEGFPNVVAEAMACGTPCVTTDVGDAARIVGETGWVVPPRNSDLLADAMYRALGAMQDRTRWKKRQQAAREQVEDKYGIEKMIRLYHAVWGQML